MIKKLLLIFLMSLLLVSFVFSASVTRSGPSTVSPNQQFSVTYTASGTSGAYGVSVEDSVTGCSPSNVKLVMTSDSTVSSSCPSPCTKTFTAPSSGTCIFTGDYKYDVQSIVAISPNLQVTVQSLQQCNTIADNTPYGNCDCEVQASEVTAIAFAWISTGVVQASEVTSAAYQWISKGKTC